MGTDGQEFLKRRFNLHAAPEVEEAARRNALRSGEKVAKPGEKIQAYLDRFKEIIEAKDPDKQRLGLAALKKVLYEAHVIQAEDIPESYFRLQQQIAREQGVTIEITPELRQEAVKVVQEDQRASLDKWIDYLASPDALYPDWAKYWAFRSLVGMSLYDREKAQFGTRSKHTTAPFPDLNHEALAYAVDLILKEARGEQIENPLQQGQNVFAREGKRVSDEAFQHLLTTENFSRYYAFAIEHMVSDNAELFKNTKGEWRVFKQGSNPLELTKTLQGHGTGWCTAGESTAAHTLKHGDFYVYYSNNSLGVPTIPRLAIRMEGDTIREVRGVAHKQEIDPYISPILEEKMTEFGEQGEKYKQKAADMRRVTELVSKNEQGEVFTRDDLMFLYEFERQIEGFGYDDDPRIEELLKERNTLADAKILFETDSDNDLLLKLLEAPDKARMRFMKVYIGGREEEFYENKYYSELYTKLAKWLPGMRDLSKQVLEKLMDIYAPSMATRYQSLFNLTDDEVLQLLWDYGKKNRSTDQYHYHSHWSKLFKEASRERRLAMIEKCIEIKDYFLFNAVLSQVSPAPRRIAELLLKARRPVILAKNLQHFDFEPKFGPKEALKIIKAGCLRELSDNLRLFEGLTDEIKEMLEERGFYNDIDNNPEAFGQSAPWTPGSPRKKT